MPVAPRVANASQFKFALKSARIAELLKTPPTSNKSWGVYVAEPQNQNHPDLGIAVAKKWVRRAVDRNTLKRMLRNIARTTHAQTLHHDKVIKLRHAVGKTTRGRLRQAEFSNLRNKIAELI